MPKLCAYEQKGGKRFYIDQLLSIASEKTITMFSEPAYIHTATSENTRIAYRLDINQQMSGRCYW